MTVRDRKAREFQRRERDILEAALALFRRPDWQAVTIDEIAARTEIGKGTVYKHFETKDEIYGRLALEFYRRLHLEVRRVDTAGDVAQALRALIRVFWEAHVRLPPEYQRVVQYCERPDFLDQLPSPTRNALREVNAEIAQLVTGLLERGMVEGVMVRRPMALAMYVLQAAVFGAIRMAWTGCIPPGQEPRYLGAIADVVAAGVLKSGGGR